MVYYIADITLRNLTKSEINNVLKDNTSVICCRPVLCSSYKTTITESPSITGKRFTKDDMVEYSEYRRRIIKSTFLTSEYDILAKWLKNRKK